MVSFSLYWYLATACKEAVPFCSSDVPSDRFEAESKELNAECVTLEDIFIVEYAMICKRGGFIIQRHHYELRDLEAELLRTVCSDVVIEAVLQDLTGEGLNRGANTAPDAQLDIQEIDIQMQIPKEKWIQTRYPGSTKRRGSVSKLGEKFTARQVEWRWNVIDSIVDLLS
ncbi:hypothetical protein P5673_032133 [Acropora cervicornis]|uniref:Uncharacterized protein n=1 Tax=Acropora cervicornis TaxID=6130 RepID=A0AAD9PSB6_ACRCE|nr:hypothetical protein P5673_032133 [Acropora cervicornis]